MKVLQKDCVVVFCCGDKWISGFFICWFYYLLYFMKDENGNMIGVFYDVFKDIIDICCGKNFSNLFNYIC